MLVTLNNILPKAHNEGYAAGSFIVTDTDFIEAVISAAEELRAPVIIGMSEALLPYGEMSLISPSLIRAAKRATVPVVVQFDHGLTLDRCQEAFKLGFSSVMFDASAGIPDVNIKITRELAVMARSLGLSVEGEPGYIVDEEDGTVSSNTPQEVKDFCENTKVASVAVAVGNTHGAKKDSPSLDTELIRSIRAEVETPLALHGICGLTDDELTSAVKAGISKINVSETLFEVGRDAMAGALKEGKSYHESRNAKVFAVKEEVKRLIRLFGSEGKA